MDATNETQRLRALHKEMLDRIDELRRELDETGQRQVLLAERNRIAQDLHDRAAQAFFLIHLKVQWLMTQPDLKSPVRAELERIGDLATQGASQMREAIYALRASELTRGGLVEGLRQLVRQIEEQGMAANLTVTGYPVPLPPAVEDALFKLAQEAMTNARKHSGGSAVMATLRYERRSVTLVVQDDGKGLPAKFEELAAHRLGLRGMRERVAGLGGELSFISDDGTIVRATIPVAGGEPDANSRGDHR